MRISAIVIGGVCILASLLVQAAETGTAPATICEDQRNGLPDFYYEAVLSRMKPPVSNASLISMSFTGEEKLILATTGDKFMLWTNTPETGNKTIHEFLRDLSGSCRLPYNPDDAAVIVKVKWESKELSPSQFAQIHDGFARAAAGYISKAQYRYRSIMESKMLTMHLDAVFFEVTYDNGQEHFVLRAWDDGEKSTDPMVKWGHEIFRLAEESFHRPFGRRSSNNADPSAGR